MAVYDLNLFADEDGSKGGEEGEEVREGVLTRNDLIRDVVDFETVGEVAYACAIRVGVGYDNDLSTAEQR